MATTLYTFANNVQTTLASPITTTTQTVITLSSTANLPIIPSGYVWAITLNDVATGLYYEICYVTSISGANLTVLRGQEGTTALTWAANDKAFGAVTAAALKSFLNSGSLGNYVLLSPASQQTGFVNVSGSITSGAQGVFASGVSAGGAITNATTGAFSGDVTAEDFIASRPYSNTALASMPLRVQGSGGTIGIGPSSGLSAHGITASALAIGLAGSSNFAAFDVNGNLGLTGSAYATYGVFNIVNATQINQNGQQVISSISSSTLSVDQSGSNVDLEVKSGAVGGTLTAYAQFTTTTFSETVSIALPSGGTYALTAQAVGFEWNEGGGGNATLEGTAGSWDNTMTTNNSNAIRTLLIVGSASGGTTVGASISGTCDNIITGGGIILLTANRTS